jgi:hypothetical protein
MEYSNSGWIKYDQIPKESEILRKYLKIYFQELQVWMQPHIIFSSTVENFCGFTLLWIPVLCSLEIFPGNNNNEFLIHFHRKVYRETISSKPEVWLSYHIILYYELHPFKRDVTTRDKQNLSLNWTQAMSGPYMLEALPCNNYYSACWNNTTECIKKIYI